MTRLARTLLIGVLLAIVSGCASDPRYRMGVTWVEEQEAERRRLQAQGFPQYSYF